MHYDYSPSLGALPAMPSPEAAAFALFIPQMQDGIAKKRTSRQIYNSIRFNDPNIAGANLTRRMNANSPLNGGYEPIFYGVREGFKANFKPKTNHDLNVKLFRAFNAALAVVRLMPLPGGAPPPPPPPELPADDEGGSADAQGGSADAQGTTPSTFPIVPVAIAAGLALLLLSRR